MDRNVLNSLLPLLQPFNALRMHPRDVGLGGPSTEYLASEYDQYQSPVNVPQIWWDQGGNPVMLSPEDALSMMALYEDQTKTYAPRYSDIGQAAEFAMHRSANGGAMTRPLFNALGRR